MGKIVLIVIGMLIASFIGVMTPAQAGPRNVCEVTHKWVGNYGEGHALFHEWYKTLSSKSGRNCCNGSECRPTQAEYRSDGWWAKVNDIWTKMPDGALITADPPDLGAHVCEQNGAVYCFDPGKIGS